MRLVFLLFVLILFSPVHSRAVEKHGFTGTISDAGTGEDLIGATLYIRELKLGTSTNTYGYFSLSLIPGIYTVEASFIGFEPQIFTLKIDRDTRRDIQLTPRTEELSEIIVRTEAINQNILNPEMGTVKLNPQTIKAIPVLFGEQDVLKTIQLLPGVSSAGEGSSGFFVRGGQADHNLVLLDDAPVFNPSHLLGFFSVFNSDAINDVTLYKGGVPAHFGGRASSVLDVHMREGNSERFSASGGIGLISSRLTLEGPIGKNGSSFLLSGRRTYADLFLVFAEDERLRQSQLYFYDLNLKTHFELGQNDRVYISGYLGRDVLNANSFGFNWGNMTGTLRWTHVFSPRLFSNTSIILNDYNYHTDANIDFSFDLQAGIVGRTLKQRFTWYLGNSNTLSFGFELNHYRFKPGSLSLTDLEGEEQNISVPEKDGSENALYLANEQKFGDRFTIGYGLRVSNFFRIGPSTEYTFTPKGEVSDSMVYASSEWYSPFWNWEPRVNATFIIDENTSIKAGYNRMAQYIHLLQNATAGTPVDFWTPSSPNVKPQVADQVSLGFFRNFSNHRYQFSVEGYYKTMQNQIDYKTGASLLLNEKVEAELLYGIGEAYGAELLLEKKEGKLTGWIAYTLSRSFRQIEGINRGNWYPARQDRVHDLAIVAMYQLNPRWTFSLNWVYYTGNAVTFPAGKYSIDGRVANLYTSRNGYRMPDYHRLDVGATWVLAKRERFQSELNFSVYNAYAQKNPYSYIFREDRDNPGQTRSSMIYLFSAVPSISWNFKF